MENKNSQITHHYHRPGGTMFPNIDHENNVISLTPDPRGNYVTWASGKKQIRFALKHAGYKAQMFRPRKVNKNEFSIMATDPNGNLCHVKCDRKPGAIIQITLVTP